MPVALRDHELPRLPLTAIFTLFGLLALAACTSGPPRAAAPPAHRENVAKHFVVIVEEEDPLAPIERRATDLVTRPVAGGPVTSANDMEKAFEMRDPRYDVKVAWRGDCLDVAVARHGLAPFPDFAAHGCVRPEGKSAPVAHVVGPDGGTIDVVVWFFEE
jgi:hypothetical protein